MPLRNTLSLTLVMTLALYLLVLVGLGSYLFWPKNQQPPLQVTRASLTPEGDRIFIEGEGFSESTEVSLSLDVNNQRFLRHTVPTYGRGADMVRVGGFAYVLVREKGLIILDLAETQRPRVISTLELPGEVWTLTVNEGVAYIACGRAGLVLVDVSDPRAPRLLATLPELQMVQGLAVRGGRLYASVYARGVDPALVVVDVSDPSLPRFFGRVSLPGKPIGVALWGEKLLVAAAKGGLLCLDLGVGLPRLSSRLPLPGSAYSLVVVGGHAYVACGLGGLAVVEMVTGAPRLQARLPLPGQPTRLVVDGERLYMVGASSGVQIIAIDRPAQPSLLGAFNQRGGVSSLVAVNDLVFFNTRKNGIQVVDLRELPPQQNPAPVLLGTQTQSVSREGELLAVTTHAGFLHLYDWRPGRQPHHLAAHALGGDEQAVTLHSGYAYIYAAGQGLMVVDVRDPRVPVAVGHYPFVKKSQPFEKGISSLSRLALSGNRGVLVDDCNRLWLFNTDHPEDLQLQPGPEFQGEVVGVAWGDDLQLYVVSGSAPVITPIDFRNPNHPVVFQPFFLPANTISHLATKGRVAVLACGLEGLITVDFSTPNDPRILGVVPLPIRADRIRLEGTVAVVGDSHGGLLMVDLNDWVTPRMRGLLSSSGILKDFVVAEQQAVVAAGSGGLLVVPLPQVLQTVARKKHEMSLTLPPIDIAGHYTLRITDGSQSVVLPGVLALAPR